MSIMHYSIHIEEALENESQVVSENAFQTKYQNSNTGITNLRITLKPRNNKSIFNNIQTTNIVKNSKGETITFNPGFYKLSEIISEINTMEYIRCEISTQGPSYGRAYFIGSKAANVTVDLTQARDIAAILGFNGSRWKLNAIPTGNSCVTEDIIDITRNNQVILVYASIVKSNELKIANQNNNLLTSVNVDDPENTVSHKIENTWIPISGDYQRIYFNFKNADLQPIFLDCDITFEFIIQSVPTQQTTVTTTGQTTQFSLFQCLNQSKTELTLPNPLSFKNCYISEVDVYTDFKLYNVTYDQIVRIYGNKESSSELTAEIYVSQGQYTIEELLALMNCSEALFELMYSGKDAFRICISDFNYIDFRDSSEVKNILGIEDTIITETKSQEIRFPLTSDMNKISVTNKVKNFTKTFELIPGMYTWFEFVDLLAKTIKDFIGLKTTVEYPDYIEFVSTDEFYFNRTNTTALNTIDKYYWMKWYTLVPSIQSNLLEKPDLNILDPNFKSNDAFWIEPDLCMCITPESTLTMDYVFYWDTHIKVTINKVKQQFNFTGNFSTQQVCDSLLSQIKNKFPGVSVELVDVSGNPSFKFTDLSTVFEYNSNFPMKTYFSTFDKSIEYKFNVKETYIKDLRVTHHDFLQDIKLDITVMKKPFEMTIPAGHYTSEQFVNKIASFINEKAKTLGVNGDLRCWNGRGNTKVVYGGKEYLPWTLVPQHYQDFYIIDNNRDTYFAYDSPQLPKWYIRLNPNHTPIRKYDLNVKIPELFQYGDLQGDGLFNKLIHGLYNGCNIVNSTNIIPLSYWDNRFVWSTGNKKISNCFTQYKTTITPGFTNKVVNFGSPQASNTYVWMNDEKWRMIRNDSTFIYNEISFTLPRISTTQQRTIQTMNQMFQDKNLDILWTPTEEGYKLLSLGGTFSGTFFNLNFQGVNKISVKPNYILWPYSFQTSNQNCSITREYYISDYPVDITNNLSQIKLFSNIVQSKGTQPLITTVDIENLNNNYYQRPHLCIPCSDKLHKLTFTLTDLNDRLLAFNGNIYLLLLFKVTN